MIQIKTKSLYILFLLLVSSCNKNVKELSINTERAKESLVEIERSVTVFDEKEKTVSSFIEEFEKLPLKEIPFVATTSFDSFIDEDDIKPINAAIFKLPAIYENWYQEGFNYRAISGFRIALSKDFYTAIIIVKKGDNELENKLITFDLNGNYIDSIVIAYDEIAEGWSQKVSRIGKSFIRIDHIFWDEIKEVTQTVYSINDNGMLEKIATNALYKTVANYTLLNSILIDLNLQWAQVEMGYLLMEELSQVTSETLVIIPEIVVEEDEVLFLNTHMVLLDPHTGIITHSLFETYKDNGWHSDAIGIEDISLDSIVYRISEQKEAFGIRIKYRSNSQPNPFAEEVISLYAKKDTSLKKILNNYMVYESEGEVNVNTCHARYNEIKNKIAIDTKKTNGCFNLLIERVTSLETYQEDENGECIPSRSILSTQNKVLAFNGKVYSE